MPTDRAVIVTIVTDPLRSNRAPHVMVSETNHRAVGHDDVIEPFRGLHIGGGLPDAVCTTARARRLKMHELYLCLVPRFVQGRAHAVMPFANDASRSVHDVEHFEWSGRTAICAHRAPLRLL